MTTSINNLNLIYSCPKNGGNYKTSNCRRILLNNEIHCALYYKIASAKIYTGV